MKYQVTTANNPIIPAYFQGRWTVKTIKNIPVMFSTNLGAELWFQVQRASYVMISMLDLAVAAGAWIAIQIDGLPYQRVAVKTLPLRLTLDGRPHVIRVVMSGNTDQDPIWDGTSGFAVSGLKTDGDLQAVKPGQHSVTFIGDSITAGCWVAGKTPAEDYRGEANYAAIASDLLGARNVRIAYSAIGLNKPGKGGVPPLPAVLTAIDGQTAWQPTPTDVVVINVGTNDGLESATSFTALLKQFINQVALLYPNSRLAVLIPFNQRFDQVIRTVVPEFMDVQLIETADWEPSTTDHVHLDLAGSQLAGHCLAQALRQLYPEIFTG
ncbi:SGNH/GDSL hydrolase family protein [Lactiplantibacillus sp. WILCCON 0030]|uniref:SGNH/GDSL hydrolase family protein n=1 Tax=Lactiplantibacillus brownii TaxID=3069269 RepID=A0ABU1AC95_9LACO|nr:SGNH/GDSL hydrolase family protein [Lactiplantibacillus brownii]MDQ7938597.1 SGNH/GDSL hydrolase family protein [Lactiplantibacillus brownii]